MLLRPVRFAAMLLCSRRLRLGRLGICIRARCRRTFHGDILKFLRIEDLAALQALDVLNLFFTRDDAHLGMFAD